MKASKSGRAGGGRWSLKATKLDLPVALLSCSFFFVAGFFFASSDSFSRHQGLVVENYNEMKVSNSRQLLAHGNSGDDFFTSIPFQVLSWNPRALYFPNFATADQCKTIINIAKPSLKPSTLALRKGETPNTTKDIRTSYGVFISSADDETGVLNAIEAKIARATMLPRANGEDFNVLRYEIGQKYDAHYDAFNPAEYGPQQSQRVASFLLYLSDVEEGGETMFPFENGLDYDEIYDFRKCLGLKVKPRQGDGLLFYSLFPNTTIDPTSIHGSCPVIKGEKWVATKWIRDQALNENSLLL